MPRHTGLLVSTLVSVLCLLPLQGVRGATVAFRRGDVNGDGRFDLSDPIATLHALFLGGDPLSCQDAADSNDDGIVDISDPLYTLLHLFAGGPPEPPPRADCGGDPTPDLLECAFHAPCDVGPGLTEFASPLAGAPGGGMTGGVGDDTGGPLPGGTPQPPAPSPDAAASGAEDPRLIEESDIYKLSGSTLFVLNRYRGLQILDLSDLDAPRLIGRASIFGWPKEMYVRGNTAYVIVSDYYEFWRDAAAPVPAHGFYGSQLRILDISDPAKPSVVGGIDLAGDCSDSRIVGDVMYLVSHRYPWYSGLGTEDTEDMTQVISVQVGDPSDVKVVDTADFPRNGWEHHVAVTESAIYIASSGYTSRDQYETRIRYVDISDPAGDIGIRGEISVPGVVRDRWAMDEYEGVLRVASGQWGNSDVYLTTISVADPDSLKRLGGDTLSVDESLTAARFDGPRGYLVSYRSIDPLFTFDLSDPVRPRLLGDLEMTGWLDFIVPMGDRLVALGHEDLTDPDGSRRILLAVSLIDVAGDDKPRLLSRVTLDGLWGWVPGTRDDFAKVFRTLAEEGLILFPYEAWDPTDWRYVGGVQLIDFDESKLTRRGVIRDAGWVERGIPYDGATVLTLASEKFQVLDISDRDAPRLRASLDLARNVQEFALLPGDLNVQLVGDWYAGDTSLVVTTNDDPDAVEPISRLHVPAPYGRLFANGSLVYVASVQDVGSSADGSVQFATIVEVVDLTDPASPRLRGKVTLPEGVWVGYRYWYWGSGDEVVQMDGSTLVFHRYSYPWILWDCPECGVLQGAADALPPAVEPTEQAIYVVDLANPDAPTVASTSTLEGVDWAWGLKAVGSMLYLSYYKAFMEGDRWMARYWLRRFDLADPANPVVLPDVNVPGMFIDGTPGTPFIYTLETWWDETTQGTRTQLHALAIVGDEARLQSSVDLDGYANGIQVRGGAAFAVLQRYEAVPVDPAEPGGGGPVPAGGGVVADAGVAFTYEGHLELVAIDLSEPTAVRLAGKAELPADYGYLQDVEAGRAFIGAGPGIFTYDVKDITEPTFERFFRTQGWTQEIVVSGARAFIPSGYYGVQVLDLSQTDG